MFVKGRSQGDDTGAIAVIVAILMVVFLGMCALVIDLGMAYDQRRVAQKAADLAALAAGQDLPNTTQAAASAAAYLNANGYGDRNLTGPMMTDGDLTNGEAVFPGQRDFVAIAGCTASPATCVQVITPTVNVKYAFEPAVSALLNQNSSGSKDVSAQATVAIKSLGTILPFVFPDTVVPGGSVCTKTKPSMSVCNTSDTGNFGFGDIPRITNDNKRLQYNLRYGAEITPAIIPNPTVVANALTANPKIDTPCPSDNNPTGAKLTSNSAPADGFTCMDTKTGVKNAELSAAWVASKNGTCDGRLALPPVGTNNCNITPDKMALGTYDDGNGGLKLSILSDPRFGVVPVIANRVLPNGGQQWAIVKFYGVYLKTLYDNKGKDLLGAGGTIASNAQVAGVDSYVFELGLLPGVASNDGGTVPYLGTGPKVPVLIR